MISFHNSPCGVAELKKKSHTFIQYRNEKQNIMATIQVFTKNIVYFEGIPLR